MPYNRAMPVTLDLSDEALARLQAEADRRGITVDVLIAELAAALPHPKEGSQPKRLRFVAMGRSTSGRHAAEADDLLAEAFGRD